MKVCSCCSLNKPLIDFYLHKSNKDGRSSICKLCISDRNKIHKKQRNENVKRFLNKNKGYRQEWLEQHPEQQRVYSRKYYVNNRERLIKRCSEYRRICIQRKIACNLRTRLNIAIKGGSPVSNLGCSISDLQLHLESKFQLNMSWQNYGKKGWHIDHIRPLASFDLTDVAQLKQACHFTNLQPLWWQDNLKKSDKT